MEAFLAEGYRIRLDPLGSGGWVACELGSTFVSAEVLAVLTETERPDRDIPEAALDRAWDDGPEPWQIEKSALGRLALDGYSLDELPKRAPMRVRSMKVWVDRSEIRWARFADRFPGSDLGSNADHEPERPRELIDYNKKRLHRRRELLGELKLKGKKPPEVWYTTK